MDALNILQGHTRVENRAYVPAGRSFFSNLNNVFEIFKNENVDPLLKEFAANLDWSSAPAGIPLSALKQEILSAINVIQGGRFLLLDGQPMFEDEKGIQLPMGMASSGTQELVPLFRIFSKLIRDSIAASGSDGPERLREHFLIVEEPEAHIFPNTQYDLMRLFAWLSYETWFSFSFTITTHSPYILSAFGNLLKAGKVGALSAGHRSSVEKTVPEKYWIKNSGFAAYKIENQVLTSIFDKKTGQIDGDYLDDVSSDIAEEFGQLLEIQYGK
jgi:hypothetical protein